MGKNDRPDNGTGRPREPYGGASVDERAQAMRGDLTDAEVAARNVIPETAPNGDPHRVIAEEYYSENDTATHWRPAGTVREGMNTPGPASAEEPKPGVLREVKKITDRITNEVPGINRVLYDVTPKPVGTIEWE